MRYVTVLLLARCLVPGAQPVHVVPRPVLHPEKFRTFYSLTDSRVPEGLHSSPAPQPVRGVNAMAMASDGAIWYGTDQGLVRFDAHAEARDRNQFFAGMRYLPDDRVLQLLADAARGMWVRTSTGVSHIELRLMTLAAKAAIFEDRVRRRHDRYGMVAPSILRVPGDLNSNEVRDDDNDGLWTSMYAAAEWLRYAVTKSPEAMASAEKSTKAVLFLEEVSGGRGFPARSYIRKGQPVPQEGQWHWTADGQYCWKGDTSSDEIVGHFFLYGIANDVLPDGPLKTHIAETAGRIMDHILDHGYYLVDEGGQPTRWGRWAPEYFAQAREDSPLNSLELLSFLKIAEHVTQNPRYGREYRKLIQEMGYAETCTRYKELRQEINYSDEELAMLSFYGLFRYETDSGLLTRYYVPALNQWWENIQREENPLWTFIYLMARPEAPADLKSALRTLCQIPTDTIDWSVKNSQRPDVEMAATFDRVQRPEAKNLLPRDELPFIKWNANPFVVDSESGARTEDDGTAFLLPYWLGRYQHRILGE